MRKFTLVLGFFALIKMAAAQNGKEPMLVTDLLKIKNIGSITLSADGSKAAFTVTAIEGDERSRSDYRYVTQIYTLPLTTSATPTQLTYAKEGASQPTWSPDGKSLAFVRGVNGRPQIFLLPMNGGEPIQLTSFKYGATNPKWSPDSKKLLFAAGISLNDLLKDSILNAGNAVPLWPSERAGITQNEHLKAAKAKPNPNGSIAEIRAYLQNNEADNKAVVLDKLNFQDERDISSDMSFTHFFIVDATPNAKPKEITNGFYEFNSADFTPDGKRIILSGDIDSLQHPDRSLESEIFIVDTSGANLQKLLGEEGKTYNSPKISPSGKWLAFLYSTTSFVNVPVLTIMPLNGTAKDIISIPFDRNKGNLTWSPDEKYLYFTAQSNGGVPLYRVAITTKKVEQLSDYNSGINSFDIGGNNIVFSKTDVANPSALYVADASLKNPKSIGEFNDWVKTKQLSFPEKKTFTNNKGMTVEYWVMKPTNYQQGKKYPLLLEIHGGPSAMWGPGEASMWHEFQYFCSQGYGVVYGNPRGSGGYGQDFLRGNVGDWGAGPTSDVLTSLDKTVAEGWADTSKLLVSGGSYAGYLVAWIVGHDKRFAAACSQRGVYDLATFFGEGNAWRLVPNYFGGYPWEPKVKELLVRESPLTYVENITTPYIIFHGSNDRRTGFVQGEMLYRSLKALNRPVEYVRHPNATHEITRSGDNRQRIDQMLRTYEFFQRWID